MRRDDVLERLNLTAKRCARATTSDRSRSSARTPGTKLVPTANVDLLVEFERPPTLLSYIDLIEYLEQLLGTRVDLATPKKLKSRARPYVERELIRVS
ncbi:MAG TPA: nucleotidyltransferase domain-containing protein [Longimicrobium sp.]|jgi:predicted nucleotidyltransferase